MKKHLRSVFSLCAGMDCLQIALVEMGVTFDNYYASEVDPNCINQINHNFPKTIQLGDITVLRKLIVTPELKERAKKLGYISDEIKDTISKIEKIDFSKIDLVGCGSPCKGFSRAGKQLNFKDLESKLFFEFVAILDYIKLQNPDVKWLFENVHMPKKWSAIISKHLYNIEGVEFDSSSVCGAHRLRSYTASKFRSDGLFDGKFITDLKPPKNRGIFIKDIVQPENEIDEKYKYSLTKLKHILEKHQEKKDKKLGYGVSFLFGDEKASTLTAKFRSIPGDYLVIGKSGEKKDMAIMQLPRGNNKGAFFYIKAPTVTACSWDLNNLLCIGNYIFDMDKYGTDWIIRRLTPIEIARLQTIPEWFQFKQSRSKNTPDTEIIKMCGNGWTIDMITHLLTQILYD